MEERLYSTNSKLNNPDSHRCAVDENPTPRRETRRSSRNEKAILASSFRGVWRLERLSPRERKREVYLHSNVDERTVCSERHHHRPVMDLCTGT